MREKFATLFQGFMRVGGIVGQKFLKIANFLRFSPFAVASSSKTVFIRKSNRVEPPKVPPGTDEIKEVKFP